MDTTEDAKTPVYVFFAILSVYFMLYSTSLLLQNHFVKSTYIVSYQCRNKILGQKNVTGTKTSVARNILQVTRDAEKDGSASGCVVTSVTKF